MLVTGNGLRLLHKQRAKSLMLKFGRVAAVKRNRTTICVQLANN